MLLKPYSAKHGCALTVEGKSRPKATSANMAQQRAASRSSEEGSAGRHHSAEMALPEMSSPWIFEFVVALGACIRLDKSFCPRRGHSIAFASGPP